MTRTNSPSNLSFTDLKCVYCGRTLDGYAWKFDDGEDGYICTAKHDETGDNVVFFKYYLENDIWVLKEYR